MYIPRAIEPTIEAITDTYPALVVTGPRQVGKSTTLKHLAKDDRTVVTLDRSADRALATYDPEAFFARYQPPVLIDEIQYAPQLLEQVKLAIDEGAEPGSFWLTGSQSFSVMEGLTESLAGRVGVVQLLGLSNVEIQRQSLPPLTIDPTSLMERAERMPRLGEDELFDRFVRGSMPRLYEVPELDQHIYYDSYIQTYLSRDVRDLAHVGDEQAFLQFMSVIAAHTATSLNYATLASEVGMSAPTIRRWLSVLISSGLVWLVHPFSSNALKRVVKAPRLYFTDTGLALHLMDVGKSVLERSGAFAGQLFETWVVSEIIKGFLGAGRRPPVYYYRDAQSREIDLLIVEEGVVHPIEIKLGTRPKNPTRHFKVLDALDSSSGPGPIYTRGLGAIICMADEPSPLDERTWYVPAWSI